jgi:hypothetical protein
MSGVLVSLEAQVFHAASTVFGNAGSSSESERLAALHTFLDLAERNGILQLLEPHLRNDDGAPPDIARINNILFSLGAHVICGSDTPNALNNLSRAVQFLLEMYSRFSASSGMLLNTAFLHLLLAEAYLVPLDTAMNNLATPHLLTACGIFEQVYGSPYGTQTSMLLSIIGRLVALRALLCLGMLAQDSAMAEEHLHLKECEALTSLLTSQICDVPGAW